MLSPGAMHAISHRFVNGVSVLRSKARSKVFWIGSDTLPIRSPRLSIILRKSVDRGAFSPHAQLLTRGIR